MKHVVHDTLGRPLPPRWEHASKLHDDILKTGNFPDPSYDACAQNYATKYLNRKDVQSAIHAKSTVWTDCGGPDYNYSDSATPMEPYWQWLVENTNLHMTVVSGDDDSLSLATKI